MSCAQQQRRNIYNVNKAELSSWRWLQQSPRNVLHNDQDYAALSRLSYKFSTVTVELKQICVSTNFCFHCKFEFKVYRIVI